MADAPNKGIHRERTQDRLLKNKKQIQKSVSLAIHPVIVRLLERRTSTSELNI